MKPVALGLVCVLAVAAQFAAQSERELSCNTSPVVRESPPPDPNADPVGVADWYVNPDRTIWAGPVPPGGWPSGGTLYSGKQKLKGQKTYWVRPQGTQLVVEGRRLDASSPPLEAHVPCCYLTGFQIVALLFPTEGCWDVHAKAGNSELRFVTLVKPSAAAKDR